MNKKTLFLLVILSFLNNLFYSFSQSDIERQSNELREKMIRIQTEGIESYERENNKVDEESLEDVFKNPRMSLTEESTNSSIKEDPWKFGKRQWYNQDDYPEYYEYKESPCFDELGWSPFIDKNVWDEKYKHCESKKNKNVLRATFFILFILGGVFVGIYFGIYKRKRN